MYFFEALEAAFTENLHNNAAESCPTEVFF